MSGEQLAQIVDLDTGDRFRFAANPEMFQDEKTTAFAQIEIPGMSHPKTQFTGGGERCVTFTARLHSGSYEDVQSEVRKLQAWMYADYEGGRLSRAPHKLLLNVGGTWSAEKWVMRSCAAVYRRFDKNLSLVYAEATMEFLQLIETSVSYGEVRG